ncbi:LPXTG cell wall anchor domain-containing protein, partial [bacterium]
CSTGNGQSWLMLAGLLAALGVALRSRKARA